MKGTDSDFDVFVEAALALNGIALAQEDVGETAKNMKALHSHWQNYQGIVVHDYDEIALRFQAYPRTEDK